jgi:hypothetical protein
LWQEAAVPGLILAGVTPDNTPSGYYWTFLFPMLLFIVIAAVLYMLFSRPHRRVPGRRIASAGVGAVPSAEIAQAASAAGGLSVAPGGDTAASVNEPEGAVLVAERDGAETDSAAAGTDSGGSTDDAAQTGQAEHAEGSE